MNPQTATTSGAQAQNEPFFATTLTLPIESVRRRLRYFFFPRVAVTLRMAEENRRQMAQDISCLMYKVGEHPPYPPATITVWLPKGRYAELAKRAGGTCTVRIWPGRVWWSVVGHSL